VSIYTQTIQGIYTALASAARTATQVINGRTLIDPAYGTGLSGNGINPEASGIIAYLNVTGAGGGGETLQLVLEEQDPVSGTWATVAATTATTATGLVRLKLKQAIVAIAASTTQVQVQDTLPAIWRIRVVHSASASWTYSLGIVLYN
jgi:hypothetical protein